MTRENKLDYLLRFQVSFTLLFKMEYVFFFFFYVIFSTNTFWFQIICSIFKLFHYLKFITCYDDGDDYLPGMAMWSRSLLPNHIVSGSVSLCDTLGKLSYTSSSGLTKVFWLHLIDVDWKKTLSCLFVCEWYSYCYLALT